MRETGSWPLLLWMALSLTCAAQAGAQTDEYGLKAEFLARFPKFTTWGTGAFANAKSPVIIGVLGKNPFGNKLDNACRTRTGKGGRPLVVKRSPNARDLAKCHIVFISKSERPRVKAAIAALGKNTLIVGDWEECARSGGAIGMYVRRGKVQFAFNPSAAKRLGIKLSSRLLDLGTIVR